MFDWLRRAYLTLRRCVRRKKEGRGSQARSKALGLSLSNRGFKSHPWHQNGDVHREIISRPDIRSPKQGRGFESPGHDRLSRWEIQRRIKDARSKRRRLKPSSRHFPPAPAFEKKHWDKKKKMEDS